MSRRGAEGALRSGRGTARYRPPGRRPQATGARRLPLWLIGGAVLLLAVAAAGWVLVGRSLPAAVGTGVGELAPDFRLVDIDGRTVTREALRGKPAVVWFTTSYCAPCQEGALRLQRILDRIGAGDRLAVVVVFVDPGEPGEALTWWKSHFGRPDWTVAFAAGSVVRDYRVRALDTKYLLDGEGLIRVVDLLPVQFREDAWTRDLTAVLGG